jgi:hypothetical protein
MASMRDLHTFLNFRYCEKFTIQVLFDNSERATSQYVQHVQLASHQSFSLQQLLAYNDEWDLGKHQE